MKKILISLFTLALAATLNSSAQEKSESPSIAKDSRCFELRTYYAAPGKLEELNARFRDHTNKLFVKHGMELIGYWVPMDKAQGDKLIYIIAHKSRDAAKKSWQDFQDDSDWKKVKAESEAKGKLVEKVESVYMAATDYSPLK
jgi:hypothetical protein